jgi:HEAT repeat protein
MLWWTLIRLRWSRKPWTRSQAAAQLGNTKTRRAVRALIASLSEDVPLVQASAVNSLARIGDSCAIDPLIAALGASDWEIPNEARKALIKIGVSAVEPLTAALNDGSELVLVQASQALGEIRDPRAIEPLVVVLKSPDPQVRYQAAKALKALGYEPEAELLRGEMFVALQRWDEALKLGAAADEAITLALKGPKHEQAAIALGKLGFARAVEPLINMLKGSSQNSVTNRGQVADALGIIGDRTAVEPLVIALNDKQNYGRSNVAKALGAIGDPRAVEPLIVTLRDPDRFLREEAKKALENIGNASIQLLISALHDSRWEVRFGAAEVLSALGYKPADERSKAEYLVAYKRWEDAVKLGAVAVEPLNFVLKDPRHEYYEYVDDRSILEAHRAAGDVRAGAARALGELKDVRSVEPIFSSAMNDYLWEVRHAATEALIKVGEVAVDFLITQLRDPGHRMPELAASVLGEIGDPRAIRPLITKIKRSRIEKGPAVRALGKLKASQAVLTLVSLKSWDAMSSIQKILESSSQDVPTDVLVKVIGLDQFQEVVPWSDPQRSCSGPHGTELREVDCSLVRQLARQELIRRGVEA